MTKIKDLKGLNPPKILMYGPPGSGKTVGGCTLGEGLEIHDWDGGLKSAAMVKDEWTNRRLEVEVKQFEDNDPTKGIAWPKGEMAIIDIVNACRKKECKIKGLMIDGMTTMSDAAMRYVQGNGGHIGKNPQIQEWGLMITLIKNAFSLLRTLPLVVIVTAHEHVYEQEKEMISQIAVPGRKLPGVFAGYFDEVWRTKVRNLGGGKVDYVIQTVSTSGTMARSRACIPDMTSMKEGMVSLLKRMGYDWEEDKKK